MPYYLTLDTVSQPCLFDRPPSNPASNFRFPNFSSCLSTVDCGLVTTTALDQSTNTIVRKTVFEEIPLTKYRFVRLRMTDWPRTTPLGVIELTAFGKAAASLPAAQPVPRAR